MRMKWPPGFGTLMAQTRRWQRTLRKVAELAPVVSAPSAKPRRKPATPAPKEIHGFGSNPGRLKMFEYVPPRLAKNAALVVVLHGCLQRVESFHKTSGWTALARQRRFVVVFPEQQEANNRNRCFNWFRPSAIARDRGELMSIRQMVESACRRHGIDRTRICVQGLSAGGAMANALLATYPDLFAAGHIVAGLPFGAARDAMTAMSVMKKGVQRSSREWADLVLAASPEAKRWPRIVIWHGTDDRVVSMSNAQALAEQWREVMGLGMDDGREIKEGEHCGTGWFDAKGKPLLEFLAVKGMAHGLPVGGGASGFTPGDFVLRTTGLDAPGYFVKRFLKN